MSEFKISVGNVVISIPRSSTMTQSSAMTQSHSMTHPFSNNSGKNGNITEENKDYAFLAHMIPHHQDAIDSSQSILLYSTNPYVRKLAENIIKNQTEEIELMRAILNSIK